MLQSQYQLVNTYSKYYTVHLAYYNYGQPDDIIKQSELNNGLSTDNEANQS